MLPDVAKDFYNQFLKLLTEYEDMKNLLLEHFTSEDNGYRLLFDWQTTRFSQFVRRYTQESQRAVFERLVKYLKTYQRQMNTIYHCDHILRDQLLIAIDVPEINRSLRERVPNIQRPHSACCNISLDTTRACFYSTRFEF
jgi:hypothetical protein